jgi:hypothetical protein
MDELGQGNVGMMSEGGKGLDVSDALVWSAVVCGGRLGVTPTKKQQKLEKKLSKIWAESPVGNTRHYWWQYCPRVCKNMRGSVYVLPKKEMQSGE